MTWRSLTNEGAKPTPIASQDPFFELERFPEHNDIPILAWERGLND